MYAVMVDDVNDHALTDRQVTATLKASATGRWAEVQISDPTEYRHRLDQWLESGEFTTGTPTDPDTVRLFQMLGMPI